MNAQEVVKLLDITSLFSGIKNLEKYVEAFPPTPVTLRAGERYQIKNSLSLFVDGKADLVKETENRSVYLKTVSDTAMLGLATLFAGEQEYISTLVAKKETSLLLFSESFVEEVITNDSEFSIRLIKLLCQKVRYLNRRIDFYTCSGAEQKLQEFLVKSADNEGRVVMSMSKISDTLGIARASLYRALVSLEEKGFIIKEGKKILLLK